MGLRDAMAIRLTEERARIGFSQADLAKKTGISREGLRLYEQGQRSLSAEFLAAAATLGLDVQYVLTGVRSRNVDAAAASSDAVHIQDGGSANVLQTAHSGSTVNLVNTHRYVTKTVAEVKPGVEHITTGQHAKLQALVKEIVELEATLKKKPATFASVWGSLNAHCKVASYKLISATDYDRAEKYLRMWIGRLNSMASAPAAEGDAWRTRKYAYIKINTKDDPEWLSRYLAKTFRATSLVDLDNADLEKAYRAVASRKRSKSAKQNPSRG